MKRIYLSFLVLCLLTTPSYALKTLLQAANLSSFGFGVTRYSSYQSSFGNFQTETDQSAPFYSPGTISGLYVGVVSNGLDGSTTIVSRINAANGNLSVSIGAGQTGWFSDLVDSDTISSGDLVNFMTTVGGTSGSILIGSSCLAYNATSNAVTMWGAGSGNGTGISDTTIRYAMGGVSTTESDVKAKIETSGTIKYMKIRINSNSSNGTVTVKSRVNGSDGNQLVSIAAGQTGWFHDAANVDKVNVGDLVDFSFVGTGNSGTYYYGGIGAEFVTSSGDAQYLGGGGVVNGYIRYVPLMETPDLNSESLSDEWKANAAVTYSHIGIYVTANALGASSTFTLYKNGSSTALSATVPANSTGWFEDNSDSVSTVAGDYLYGVYSNGSGVVSFLNTTMVGHIDSAASVDQKSPLIGTEF